MQHVGSGTIVLGLHALLGSYEAYEVVKSVAPCGKRLQQLGADQQVKRGPDGVPVSLANQGRNNVGLNVRHIQQAEGSEHLGGEPVSLALAGEQGLVSGADARSDGQSIKLQLIQAAAPISQSLDEFGWGKVWASGQPAGGDTDCERQAFTKLDDPPSDRWID